tara:strand:- start:113 stop:487 length:375 start_codon:yes stop_codon:yes gene_type:complete
MKNSITSVPRTPRLDKRIGSARRTARWREAHPEHVDTRVLDRVLLEAAFLVLTDGKTVPTSITGRILPAIIEAATAGLEDKGYRGSDVKLAVGRRIRRHAEDRVVGRAVRIRKLMATPIQDVSE